MNWIKKLFGVESDRDARQPEVMTAEDAECLIDGKAISIQYHDIRTQYVEPDDTFRLRIHGEAVHEEVIGEPMKINRVAMFRTKDALGFTKGIGAIFGQKA